MLIAGTVTGCGTSLPLLYPAHPLPAGGVTVGVGASTTAVAGEPSLDTATSTDDRLRAAAADAIDPEAVAPWVGARVGLGADTEAGFTTSGRAARLDGRHVWTSGNTALSVGAGLDALVRRLGSDAGLDRVHGLGFEIPVVVGMRSDGDVLRGWLGARAGYRGVSGPVRLALSPAGGESNGDVTGSQWSAGGVVGLATGLRPIWVAVELDVDVVGARADWSFDDGTRRSTSLHAVSFVPGGAIFTKF